MRLTFSITVQVPQVELEKDSSNLGHLGYTKNYIYIHV